MTRRRKLIAPPRVVEARAVSPVAPAMAGRTLVFSFGSNLYDEQMFGRCPDALVVGPATIEGYRLAFVEYSSRWGGAVATLRRDAGASAPGELVLLGDEDLRRLDGYEGAPSVYRRVQVRVAARVASGGTRTVTAWTYVRDGEENVPSLTYVARIAHGYGRLGYGDEPIVRAIQAAERAVHERWSRAASAHRTARAK